MHYEHTRGMRAKKYLRESCYHSIECSIANSLATLMRKWYINSAFQPYKQSTVHVEGRNEKGEII